MPKSPALLLSGLFHPLLVPTYMFLLAVLVDPFAFGSGGLGDFRSLGTLLMIVLYTCIIPAISVFIMLKLEMVNSIMMEDRMERVGPLLLVMILYFWVYYNLSQHNDTPRFFIATLLGVVIALAVAFVINVVDKISLHAVGMGGLAGMVLILTGMYGGGAVALPLPWVALATVVLAGVGGVARLSLGQHDRPQLYGGYLVGFVAQWLALKFYY